MHLHKHHGAERAQIMGAILTAAAVAEDGITEAVAQMAAQFVMKAPDRRLTRELVHALIDARYLDLHPDGRMRFVNPLFRRWWLRFEAAP